MSLPQTTLEQQAMLPVPSGALVIDTRCKSGNDLDNVIKLLEIEIEDLTSEIKVQDVPHWRYLSHFLSFEALKMPLSEEEIRKLRSLQQPSVVPASANGAGNTNAQNGQTTITSKPTLVGPLDILNTPSYVVSSSSEDGTVTPKSESPDDILPIDKFINEIDRIRNNRIVAVGDIGKAGIVGRNIHDATIRVIFLTDATIPNSLDTAVAYASRLKEYYQQLERSGHQRMISNTVVCLNNSSTAASPKELIDRLLWNGKWDHLDSLIISETYHENSARIPDSMQAYLAELLLYALLISPPLPINVASTSEKNGSSASNTQEQHVSLPPSTFVVGLAAMEHSARWGRRLLNYGLAEEIIQVLQDKPFRDERQRAQNTATQWLNEWCMQVAGTIPEQLPGDTTELRAISKATQVASIDDIFTSNRFTPRIGISTIDDLRRYQEKLAQTYTIDVDEQEKVYSSSHSFSRLRSTTGETTLQSAIDSIPLIQQQIHEMENGDSNQKDASPLVKALITAQRVLSSRKFFTAARGAIPRARLQLTALGDALATLQQRHEHNQINLVAKRQAFEDKAKNKIDELEKHTKAWPFFATFLHLKKPMALITLLFILLTSLIGIATLFAWLIHLLVIKGPEILLSYLANPLLFGISTLTYVVGAVIIVVLLLEVAFFWHVLLNERRSGFQVEVSFWLLLLVSGIAVLLLTVSSIGLRADAISDSLLSWLVPVAWWSSIAFAFVFVMLLAEFVYTCWWVSHLFSERTQIAKALQTLYRDDVDEVRLYLADTVALELAEQAGLIADIGEYGRYYTHIDAVSRLLDEMLEEAKGQQTLAANRIISSQSETQLGTEATLNGSWLNLRIRDEILNVKALTVGYRRLKDNLGHEPRALKGFAQILLRILGEEHPADIEQDLYQQSIEKEEEERYTLTFLSILVAEALRAARTHLLADRTSILNKRYKQLSFSASQFAAITDLLEKLDKKAAEATLEPLSTTRNMIDKPEPDDAFATKALAIWGQKFWEEQDHSLDKVLASEGVLPQLVENGYKEQNVKRLLGLRNSLSGRSTGERQIRDLYLLLPRSPYSYQYTLGLQQRQIIDFPDTERLVLLQIQQYAAKSLFITSKSTAASGTTASQNQNGA